MLATALRAPRRGAWALLLLAVLLGHALLVWWVQVNTLGWGAGDAALPPRIDVSFVRELNQATPPSVAPAPAAPPAGRQALRKAKPPPLAASAPEPPLEPEPEPEPVAEAPPQPEPAASTVLIVAAATPVVDAASAPAGEASAAAASAPTPPAASPAFEWPPSTRLSYRLSGNYRGEVSGSARVQWVRQGLRYQVHLDLLIGPSFAPLISRRMTSDGELSAEGLAPRRYDEATRVMFQSPRIVTLLFEPERITLANGNTRATLPGVQDPASQFVQMTWLFTMQPQRLRVGSTVTMPLALPRRVDRWVYDVLGDEVLQTPFGALPTVHLKPRLGERRANELSAEIWFAPTLQYLPVRIRIAQDVDTFIDLLIDTPPLQAAPTAIASAPAGG